MGVLLRSADELKAAAVYLPQFAMKAQSDCDRILSDLDHVQNGVALKVPWQN